MEKDLVNCILSPLTVPWNLFRSHILRQGRAVGERPSWLPEGWFAQGPSVGVAVGAGDEWTLQLLVLAHSRQGLVPWAPEAYAQNIVK